MKILKETQYNIMHVKEKLSISLLIQALEILDLAVV